MPLVDAKQELELTEEALLKGKGEQQRLFRLHDHFIEKAMVERNLMGDIGGFPAVATRRRLRPVDHF
jgi:hypothetical protein